MTNFAAYSGLYRVWVPLRDDGKSPLISTWIDRSLPAFESCSDEKGTHVEPLVEERRTK